MPVVLDSFVTGARAFVGDRACYEGDVGDRELLARILSDHPDIGCTVHMAARVVVPESMARPALYYRENVSRSVELFDELARRDRPRVIFSSSAAVYAPVAGFEVTEDSPLGPSSPYARSKLMTEQVLADMAAAGDVRAVVLRYFNPVGSDPDLESGAHQPRPSHVLGQMLLAALGRIDAFTLTGTQHPTRDGSGIRDYVHAWDLARAHVRAVERLDEVLTRVGSASTAINVGTGRGVTVRELLKVVEDVHGRPVPTVEGPPRPGDPAGGYANVDRARRLLDWQAELSLVDGVRSALGWLRRRRAVLGYD